MANYRGSKLGAAAYSSQGGRAHLYRVTEVLSLEGVERSPGQI